MTTSITTPVLDRPGSPDAPDGPSRRVPRIRWYPVALTVLLLGTAALYLVGLGSSGYANEFYAAAVQSGTQSWKAWLFGSVDPGGAITVDKPPAALWVMGLSARIFGFNSWSLLVPQALEGVAAVALLTAAVRRWSGPAAGIVAGAALALTPVAVVMFRYDNPDALLVLLLVAAAYCVVQATERANGLWLSLAGVAVGFAFLTKMMQAFLVLPAFVLVYLVVTRTGLARRIRHVLIAGVAMVVSAGWFVALVELWPASSRPYIGGSTNNSLLELALGYNGFARLAGGAGNAGGGAGGGMFGGEAGIGRLFGSSFGPEIAWLLPAALIALVAGLWFTRRAPRTGRTRAALLLWGGWLVVTGLVFSFMQGTVHPYYMVALAPAVAALVAVGGRELWRGRAHFAARACLAAMVFSSGVCAFVMLNLTPNWLPWLRWLLVVLALVVSTALLMGVHRFRRAAVVLLVGTLLAGFGGSAAYAVDTATHTQQGPIPTSGPNTRQGFGGPGGGGSGGAAPGGQSSGQGGGQTGGQGGGRNAGGGGAVGRMPGGGGPGGQASAALVALLRGTSTTWSAATLSSQSAASLELASGKSVLGIGGFTGSDNAPTLAQFQQYVAEGKVRYFVADGRGGGFGGPGGGSGSGSAISAWVTTHFAHSTVGGQTVYDLTRQLGA